jgi:hypothetical protein
VVAFTRWVGPGRRVTQTGRLTLAQARKLVPALNTGDVIDPVVDGRVHRTTSSEELPELNTTCAWAKAARLVRVTGGKLVAVQKNAVLLERPVPLWEWMFATFGALGPAICPPGWGESLLRGHFAEGIRAVLSGVAEHDGPAGLDLVCQWGWHAVSHRDRVAGLPAIHWDTWRRCNDRDVHAAVGVLARFGALRLEGPSDARVVALTPLGRATLPSCW